MIGYLNNCTKNEVKSEIEEFHDFYTIGNNVITLKYSNIWWSMV